MTSPANPEIRFQKVPPGDCLKTAYQVLLDGEPVGYVWSFRGFSYRGMQGWNRGVRLQDFHPTEWRYGPVLGGDLTNRGAPCYDRQQGAEALAGEARRRKDGAR